MIRLFVSDIDGCLSEPYQVMDLGTLTEIAGLARTAGQLGGHAHIPALSLCSGRPMSYVESMTQLLGIQMPVLFESGGGIFDPVAARVHWSPNLTPELLEEVREVTRWLEIECVPGTSMRADYAKRAHAGVIGPDPDEILAAIPHVQAFVDREGLNCDVLPTHLSIDVVPRGITKETGMDWLAEMLDIRQEEIAYIGDSMGDFKTLQQVGASFAPQNAKAEVRAGVHHVMPAHAQGVLAALKMCIARNQQSVEIEELRK